MSAKAKKSESKTRPSKHKVVSRKTWLAARVKFLKAEKALTRQSDELARKRQELPWVKITKPYRFDTDDGAASLGDLFQGRSQLLIYHFMFGPDYAGGCPACSSIADGFNGFTVHLANHDVMLWAVSRAPLAKLQAYKQRLGWTFPWASSSKTDFNDDFNVHFTDEQQRKGKVEYNYRREPAAIAERATEGKKSREWHKEPEDGGPVADVAALCGVDAATFIRERPGMSAFTFENGNVYHTYSAFSRGLDGLWGLYQWLDRAPKGRNETGFWFRRRDEYGKDAPSRGSCCEG
ncbi:MAG TPA: thioredoxin family protein [Verrucomicrobiae bacterium]|jgi:predicted dithiol-disulfide oxidoreductase (DUF899 family)|nr:thioredoxin family protein [Verrucomicrobiae bacterium]